MQSIRFLSLALLLLALIIPTVASAKESPQSQITHLLNFVERSGVTFIRNGKKHTCAEAAEHMRKKQKHYEKKIKSPEDFIRLTATKSLVTGKKYEVVTTEGKTLLASDWLLAELKRARKSAQ